MKKYCILLILIATANKISAQTQNTRKRKGQPLPFAHVDIDTFEKLTAIVKEYRKSRLVN